jgi:hypothetical protein
VGDVAVEGECSDDPEEGCDGAAVPYTTLGAGADRGMSAMEWVVVTRALSGGVEPAPQTLTGSSHGAALCTEAARESGSNVGGETTSLPTHNGR